MTALPIRLFFSSSATNTRQRKLAVRAQFLLQTHAGAGQYDEIDLAEAADASTRRDVDGTVPLPQVPVCGHGARSS